MNEPGTDSQNPFSALKAVERTDRGRVRENNEDVALCLPEAGLFAVADGMGGAREGEVAARVVADHLKDAFTDPTLALPGRIRRCRESINAASLWIRQYAARQGNPGMGTTVVLLLFDPDDPAAAVCLHAGDSRLYRYRGGELEQLTRDHSMASLAGAAHDGQVPSMFRSVITRAVGVRRDVELETTFLAVERDDLFLLCTDGLHGFVSREEMSRMLERGADLDTKAVSLVESALSAGGEDNVTVVLVRAGGAPEGAGGGAAGASSERVLPPSAREGRDRHEQGKPLISILMIALLGFIALWFAFGPWPRRSAAAPPAPADPPAPSLPAPAPAPSSVPVLDTPAPVSEPAPAPRLSPEAAWGREREEVAADADRMKERHRLVLAAFSGLGEWTGRPLHPPSLMFAGRPEERPGTWARYLAGAQTQWCAAVRADYGRQRAESACLTPPGLRALWREAQGTDADDPKFRALLAACDAWRRELDRMGLFLDGSADPAVPFLYACPADLFTPGHGAAALADQAWDPVMTLINSLWEKRDALIAGRDAEGVARVDETLRQANAIWAGYVGSGHAIRAWRRAMDPAAVAAFFDRLAVEDREGTQEKP